MTDEPLLPEGAILVHIGPYKTGTTAIQTSLHIHRDDLLRHGVFYPGPDHRQFRPGWALMGRGPRGVGRVPRQEWDELVAEIRGSTAPRVCLSTEDFASATVEQVGELVSDLGPERVHVLYVVRRLDRLLPSAWQQRVKSSNEARTYHDWLGEVLAEAPRKGPGYTFWRNHGVARMLSRWHPHLAPEHVTLLVADESDRHQQMRTFEVLLGLPQGLLTPGPRDNTSLTLDKIELYRLVNEAFDRNGWDDTCRRKLLHRGMLNGLREAPAHETDVAIPALPRWAAERVAELSDDRVKEVVDSGAVVIGDPDTLRVELGDRDDELPPAPETILTSTAARAIEALVAAALRAEQAARNEGRRAARPAAQPRPALADTRSVDLLREVARRTRRRLGR